MIKLGITGTIGSGKSVVSQIFETIGIPVYMSDFEAKNLMIRDKDIISALKNRFGNQVYIDNNINKQFLASRIFNNENDRQFVNSIVHPAVINDFIKWVSEQKNSDIVAIESALIFESGIEKHLDYTIIVESPIKLASERISKRDFISHEEAVKKINLQLSNVQKNSNADFYVQNDEINSLIIQCLEIIKKIRKSNG
ncbi:MAG: dephospho-CoA kinase [Bacteroidales bacterium]|nr:dephospho-CoA kinase [Bacteroidales bacterium]